MIIAATVFVVLVIIFIAVGCWIQKSNKLSWSEHSKYGRLLWDDEDDVEDPYKDDKDDLDGNHGSK